MIVSVFQKAAEHIKSQPTLFYQFAFWYFMIHGLNLLALNGLSTTGVMGGFWVFTFMAYLILQVTLMHATWQGLVPVQEQEEGADGGVNISLAFSWGLRNWWRFFIVNLLYGLLVVGGAVVLIVPGIYLAVVCGLASTLVILEPCSIFDSFSLSQQWLKNYFKEMLALGALLVGVGLLTVLLGHPILVLMVQAVFGVFKTVVLVVFYSEIKALNNDSLSIESEEL